MMSLSDGTQSDVTEAFKTLRYLDDLLKIDNHSSPEQKGMVSQIILPIIRSCTLIKLILLIRRPVLSVTFVSL